MFIVCKMEGVVEGIKMDEWILRAERRQCFLVEASRNFLVICGCSLGEIIALIPLDSI